MILGENSSVSEDATLQVLYVPVQTSDKRWTQIGSREGRLASTSRILCKSQLAGQRKPRRKPPSGDHQFAVMINDPFSPFTRSSVSLSRAS